MEISNKKLKKALEAYEKGKYKEALKICNKVLTKEYNNEEALTLEGEILFKAGRIDDAVVTWKINAEYNNNALAKEHLAKVDSEVKENALSYTSIINVEEIRNALAKAEAEKKEEENKADVQDTVEEPQKVESETASIKEESTPVEEPSIKETVEEKTIPSIKEEPKEIEEKVEEISKEELKQIEKTPKEEPKKVEEKPKEEKVKTKPTYEKITPSTGKVNSKNGFNKKIVAIVVAGVVVIGGGIAIASTHSSSSKDKSAATKIVKPKIDWTGFNQNMDKALQANDYNQIYNLLAIAPFNEVPKANLGPYESALAVMGTSGNKYFYDTGMADYKAKNYTAAIENFKKGLAYSVGNYLEPHFIYFIGASYSGLQDHTEAVKYYKEYLEKFPNADIYNSGCLYILAKYYYSIGDKASAQTYAKELQSKFPNSPYNNNDIASIANGQ